MFSAFERILRITLRYVFSGIFLLMGLNVHEAKNEGGGARKGRPFTRNYSFEISLP